MLRNYVPSTPAHFWQRQIALRRFCCSYKATDKYPATVVSGFVLGCSFSLSIVEMSATISRDFSIMLKLCGLFRFKYVFICQCTSTRRQRSDLFGLRVKLPPVTHWKRQFRLSALPKDTTSELAGLISTLTLLNAERQAGKL